MKVKRCNFIPENEIGIIKDLDTLIHNIVTPELKELQQENKQLKEKIGKAKEYIKNNEDYKYYYKFEINVKKLLELLGEKENE